VRDDRIQSRGLTGDDKIESLLAGQRPGAVLAALLAAQAGKPNFVAERRQSFAHFAQGPEHRGHRPFGIARPPPPDAPVAQFAAEGIDGHAADAHRIGMRGEEQARFLCSAIGKPRDHVGPAGEDVAQFHVRRREFRAQPLRQPFRDGLLASVRRPGIARRVHARNANERLQQFDNGAGQSHVLKPYTGSGRRARNFWRSIARQTLRISLGVWFGVPA
jgi:hypothetical protein